MRCDLIGDEASANRHATAERLRKRDDIGHYTVACRTAREEPFASASNTSLHFVVNQHDPALVAQFAQRAIEARLSHAHTGHRLNRFQHDRGHSFVRQRAHRLDVAKLGLQMPRHVWLSELAILTEKRRADRVGSAAMKATGEGDDLFAFASVPELQKNVFVRCAGATETSFSAARARALE